MRGIAQQERLDLQPSLNSDPSINRHPFSISLIFRTNIFWWWLRSISKRKPASVTGRPVKEIRQATMASAKEIHKLRKYASE